MSHAVQSCINVRAGKNYDCVLKLNGILMAARIGESTLRRIFGIPEWYIFSQQELQRLSGYVRDSQSLREVMLSRYLDCEAFCEGENCFFCGEIIPVFPVCCKTRLDVPRLE